MTYWCIVTPKHPDVPMMKQYLGTHKAMLCRSLSSVSITDICAIAAATYATPAEIAPAMGPAEAPTMGTTDPAPEAAPAVFTAIGAPESA